MSGPLAPPPTAELEIINREISRAHARSIRLPMLNERYAEYDQVGFLATLRVDLAVTSPVHFCKLVGIIPPA